MVTQRDCKFMVRLARCACDARECSVMNYPLMISPFNGFSEFKPVTKEICKLPSFFSTVLFRKIDTEGTGIVTR